MTFFQVGLSIWHRKLIKGKNELPPKLNCFDDIFRYQLVGVNFCDVTDRIVVRVENTKMKILEEEFHSERKINM